MNEIIFHIYQPSNITKNSIKLDSKLNNTTLKDYFNNNIVHIFNNYNKEDNIEQNIQKENIEQENIEQENIEQENIEQDKDIYKNYYFLDNFTILPYDTLLKSITNEIIIMNKNLFQKKKMILIQ